MVSLLLLEERYQTEIGTATHEVVKVETDPGDIQGNWGCGVLEALYYNYNTGFCLPRYIRTIKKLGKINVLEYSIIEIQA